MLGPLVLPWSLATNVPDETRPLGQSKVLDG